MNVPFIGSKISLISKSRIRYEGILFTIDTEKSQVALRNVRSFGTEDRATDKVVPPSAEVWECIIFRGSDIQDLHVCEAPPPAATTPAPVSGDPAIVSVPQIPPGPNQYPGVNPYGFPQQGYPAYGYPYGYSPYGYGYPPQQPPHQAPPTAGGVPPHQPGPSPAGPAPAAHSPAAPTPFQPSQPTPATPVAVAPVEKPAAASVAPTTAKPQPQVALLSPADPVTPSNPVAAGTPASTTTAPAPTSTSAPAPAKEVAPVAQNDIASPKPAPTAGTRPTSFAAAVSGRESQRGSRGRGGAGLRSSPPSTAQSAAPDLLQPFDFESANALWDKQKDAPAEPEKPAEEVVKPAYSKGSFFDSISCETSDRQTNSRVPSLHEQRQLDSETFGSSAVQDRERSSRRHHHHHSRGYRGGRGRGGPRGRYHHHGGSSTHTSQ